MQPLDEILAQLPPGAKILDAGAWFNPCPRATHVVDLMPWETRRCKLQLERQPAEQFSKETWHQVDFLDPALRLPFSDHFFDFSICSHTLEDLAEPAPLIRELQRVSRRGYVEVPSRLMEQTRGVRDRACSLLGHPHHHWIIDREGAGELVFYRKKDLAGPTRRFAIPLLTYERIVKRDPTANLIRLLWDGSFGVRFVTGEQVLRKAIEYRKSLPISTTDIWACRTLRLGRRVRDRLYQRGEKNGWWDEIVALSRPYSRIEIR